MAGDLDALRGKIQKYLTHTFSNVTIDRDGDFSLRHGSARVFIRAATREDSDWTWVNVWVPVLLGIKETPALFEYVALHADDYIFGHLHAVRLDEGITIGLRHALPGDYLDEDELVRVVAGLLSTADHLDDELKSQFGGTRFHED